MVAATDKPSPKPRPRVIPQRKAEGKELLANRPLTRAEKRFCQLVAMGWPLARCYLQATGSDCTKANAEKQAWRWRMRPVVEQEIVKRRAKLDDATAFTRAEKRNIVASIGRDESTPAMARLGAVALDNRMTGHDEPERASGGGTAGLVFSVDPMRDVRRAESIPLEDTTGEQPKLAP